MDKMLFGKRMWAILVGTALVFGGLLTMQWYGRIKMNEAMDNMPIRAVTISAAKASTARWRPSVESVGTLAAIRGAELATEVPGVVEEIFFDNGSKVPAGAVILSLNSAPDRAELTALEAAARLAELELERATSLVSKRNISKSELDQRSSQLDQARAGVEAQKARIELKHLRAPYAGRLGIRRVNVGDYVQAGDTVIELQALDRLYVNFTLPEQYSSRVSTGMTVRASLQALRGEQFSGEITAIAPVIDPETRNFALQGTLVNRDDVLRPGMFARLTLPLGEEREWVIVPRTAIAYRPYGNSVYVLQEADGGGLQVSQRFVTLGPVRGDMIAIEKGLSADERVATSGLLKLDSGVPVEVDNSVQPPSSLNPQPDNS
jgi:membrane fusion protein (multidrug efflux system)